MRMTTIEQKRAAQEFVKRWKAMPCVEEEHSRSFWIELLEGVLGLPNAMNLNLKRPEGAFGPPGWAAWRFAPADFRAVEGVVSYRFGDVRGLSRALAKPGFLDWSYRLNVEFFRKCKNPLGGSGNPLLMKAILDR